MTRSEDILINLHEALYGSKRQATKVSIGGAVRGAVLGSLYGVVVGGPVGLLAGLVVGGVSGAASGAAIGGLLGLLMNDQDQMKSELEELNVIKKNLILKYGIDHPKASKMDGLISKVEKDLNKLEKKIEKSSRTKQGKNYLKFKQLPDYKQRKVIELSRAGET